MNTQSVACKFKETKTFFLDHHDLFSKIETSSKYFWKNGGFRSVSYTFVLSNTEFGFYLLCKCVWWTYGSMRMECGGMPSQKTNHYSFNRPAASFVVSYGCTYPYFISLFVYFFSWLSTRFTLLLLNLYSSSSIRTKVKVTNATQSHLITQHTACAPFTVYAYVCVLYAWQNSEPMMISTNRLKTIDTFDGSEERKTQNKFYNVTVPNNSKQAKKTTLSSFYCVVFLSSSLSLLFNRKH